MVWHLIWISLLLSSCTITFQNVSTVGKATDVIDDELSTKADIQTSASMTGI